MLDEYERLYFSQTDPEIKKVRHEPDCIPNIIWPCSWSSICINSQTKNITIGFLRSDGKTIYISLTEPSTRNLAENLQELINTQTTNHGTKAEQLLYRIDAAIKSITQTIDEMNQAILRLAGDPPSGPHDPQSPPAVVVTMETCVKP